MEQLVKAKLLNFLKFKRGWGAMGEGAPFTQKMVDEILDFFHKHIEGKFESDVFPGLGGEIMLTLYLENGYYYEIMFEQDGTYSVNIENEKEEEISEEINLTYKDIVNIVAKLDL